jgi:hypothetical protein
MKNMWFGALPLFLLCVVGSAAACAGVSIWVLEPSHGCRTNLNTCSEILVRNEGDSILEFPQKSGGPKGYVAENGIYYEVLDKKTGQWNMVPKVSDATTIGPRIQIAPHSERRLFIWLPEKLGRRLGEGGVRVVLVDTRAGRYWSAPKLNAGESPEQH